MVKTVGVCFSVFVAVGAAGSASGGSIGSPPLHRGCPPDARHGPAYLVTSYDGALKQAKRAFYGQKLQVQGQTYITSARNTELVAAVHVQNLDLVPGMRRTFTIMHRRCGTNTPYLAWAFTFHKNFDIVPDYVPTFVVHMKSGWYVF